MSAGRSSGPRAPSTTGAGYRRLLYRVRARHHEALAAWLWSAGTLGLEELAAPPGWARFVAYFAAGEAPGPAPAALGATLESEAEQPQEDWLAVYRESARPIAIGRRLMIDPREPGSAPPARPGERILLSIPARNAFGTGSHESTRLVLELLEELPLAGRRVLDVGAGSGILGFAALALGARAVVGVEIDTPSVLQARQSARRNRLHPALVAGGLEVLAPDPAFSLALVNILPERMLPWIDRLPPLLEDGGEAVFSGLLAAAAEPVIGRLSELGFTPEASRTAGEWIAYRCRYRRARRAAE